MLRTYSVGILLILLAGCGDKPAPSGVDGMVVPRIDSGNITLHPEGAGTPLQAGIVDGFFSFDPKHEIRPGKYRAEVTRTKPGGAVEALTGSDPKQSGPVVEITPGANHLEVRLSAKKG